MSRSPTNRARDEARRRRMTGPDPPPRRIWGWRLPAVGNSPAAARSEGGKSLTIVELRQRRPRGGRGIYHHRGVRNLFNIKIFV
jgi:hypothetical protein